MVLFFFASLYLVWDIYSKKTQSLSLFYEGTGDCLSKYYSYNEFRQF
jgi:hypothetical protein